jgi:hypothetical protein
MQECGADTNGDGAVDVNDLLGVLSAFGSADAAADMNDDGSVDVNDLLGVLSDFGGDLSACGADGGGGGMAGGGGGNTVGVNCCGGGTACGYIHCPALGADQAGCVQPWALPNGMTQADCAATAVVSPAPTPAPLWCPTSPLLTCRM